MHQHDRLLPTMAYCLPTTLPACLPACRVNKTQTFERARHQWRRRRANSTNMRLQIGLQRYETVKMLLIHFITI